MSAAFRLPYDLEDIEVRPGTGQDVRLEPTAKRVRPFFGDVAIADSTRVQLMFESRRLPVYYFPVEDVRMDLLVPGTRTESSPVKGVATYFSLQVGNGVAPNAAWRYGHSSAGCPDLSGLIAFHWRQMDAWFEEDEEVLVHARDPYHRIDVLRSSRRVEVRAEDAQLADTRNARMLFETGLPVRYYIPAEDIHLELLTPSDSVTACAYKGRTSAYWDLAGGARDIAWSYKQPAPEVSAIAGLISFFNERVDIAIEGVPQPRPQTPWS